MRIRRAAMRASLALLLGATAGGCRSEERATHTPAPAPTVALPAEWAGQTNPLPDDEATIARGRAVFLTNCAPCHGPEADGKGVASNGLVPPPANFRDGKRLSSKDDDFLFWRISEGITGTAMPAFGATIAEDDRWAILRFLRSLSGAERVVSPAKPERT